MKTLALDLNDEELFETISTAESFIFLDKHIEAFVSMCQEQGEQFWLRYLISFRDYTYNRGFPSQLIESSPHDLCRHNIMLIGDDIFVTIHEQFVVNSSRGNIKSFTSDILCLVRNKDQLLTKNGKSIVNNPFYAPETRESFRRLLRLFGYFQSGVKQHYIFGIAIPTYMTFSGGLCVFLKKWLKTKENCEINIAINKLWTLPSDWKKSGFLPNYFEKHLANVYQKDLSAKLDINGLPMKSYNNMLKDVKSERKDKQLKVPYCSCKDTQTDFLKNITDCKWKKFPGAKVQDADSDEELKEELKRTILFQMAETKYGKESNDDLLENESNGAISKKKKPKKKKKKKKTGASSEYFKDNNDCIGGEEEEEPQQHANAVYDDIVGYDDETLIMFEEFRRITERHNLAPTAFGVNLNMIPKLNKKGKKMTVESNLSVIHNNLNQIENCIHETGGLDEEHFSLMLKTGSLLKENPKPTELSGATNSSKEGKKTQVKEAKKCAGCYKIEDDGIKMKKCALCKKENIAEPRFYCSRDCQIDDWTECHQSEHEKGILHKI